VITLLQREEATLAVSYLQILELAAPSFTSLPDLKALLSDLPHVLANPFENVADEEIAFVVARVNGLSRRPPRVFARDTSEWGYHVGPVGGTAVDMLDAVSESTEQRDQIRAMAKWGAESSMLKGEAALAKNPKLPLTLAVQHHLDQQRKTYKKYGMGLSAEEIVKRAGGRAAFPGYEVQESLVAERMADKGQKSSANDVFDEFIAFYAPYAAATAVDKRTLHRAKMAKLPAVPRMTRYLSEIPSIVERVRSGALTVMASAF
jgi:hypothetical protein